MKKILIVDDLLPFVEKQKSILNRANFLIFTATSAEQALQIHKETPMDMIIADLDMPVMNGDEMCRVIRGDESMRKVSIVMVCSNKRADMERCMSAGANEHITKPIDSAKLLEKVSILLSIPERKHLRVLTKVSVKGNFKHESFFGTTQDISISGLLLETDRALARKDPIVCSFFIPDAERIEVSGEIVRIVKQSTSKFQYGVRFSGLSPDVKKTLEAYIFSKAG